MSGVSAMLWATEVGVFAVILPQLNSQVVFEDTVMRFVEFSHGISAPHPGQASSQKMQYSVQHSSVSGVRAVQMKMPLYSWQLLQKVIALS